VKTYDDETDGKVGNLKTEMDVRVIKTISRNAEITD
jgi:hypothetical protein